MGIFNSGVGSTAQLTPVIFSGKGASSPSEGTSDMYRLMQMNQKREAVEDKNVSSFETEMGKVTGLEGDIKYVQRALIDNEMNRRILRQQANSLIMSPNVTDTQLNGILEKYQQGRMSLEGDRYNILMNKDQMKNNLEFYTQDVKDNKDQYGSPVLNMDFGSAAVSSNTMTAGQELFMNGDRGVVLSQGGRAITKGEFLNKRPDMQLVEEDGSVAKYMPMVQSMSDEKYLGNIRGRMTDAASKISSNTNIVGDMKEMLLGAGYMENSSKNNYGALNDTMKNIYSMMTTTEKNRAAERLLLSNLNGKVVIAPSKGDKGYTFEGSFTKISEEIAKQKAIFNDTKKSDDERNKAGRNGVALAAKFVQGVQAQATMDASNQSTGLWQQNNDPKFVRPTDKYIESLATNASLLLAPERLVLDPNKQQGFNVYEKGVLKTIPDAFMSSTPNLVAQKTYLKGFGIDLDSTNPDDKRVPHYITEITDNFMFNGNVHTLSTKQKENRDLYSKMQIIGVNKQMVVMPGITNNTIDQNKGPASYMAVRVLIPDNVASKLMDYTANSVEQTTLDAVNRLDSKGKSKGVPVVQFGKRITHLKPDSPENIRLINEYNASIGNKPVNPETQHYNLKQGAEGGYAVGIEEGTYIDANGKEKKGLIGTIYVEMNASGMFNQSVNGSLNNTRMLRAEDKVRAGNYARMRSNFITQEDVLPADEMEVINTNSLSDANLDQIPEEEMQRKLKVKADREDAEFKRMRYRN